MAQYKVMLARLTLDGNHRTELVDFVLEAALYTQKDPRLADLIHVPISRCPTPVARNFLVKLAREHGCDILVMCDDDMRMPSGFFKTAVNFLLAHDGPAAIGAAYVCGPPREDVQVFEWASGQSGTADTPWAVANITREDAVRRTGIEKCCNIGTGLIAYKVSCFDKVEPPWFDYSYSDQFHTQVIETEDCHFHRRAHFAGVPLYVSWDHWCDHYKVKMSSKPAVIDVADVKASFQKQANAQVKHLARSQESEEKTRYLAALRSPAPTKGTPWPQGEELERLRAECTALLRDGLGISPQIPLNRDGSRKPGMGWTILAHPDGSVKVDLKSCHRCGQDHTRLHFSRLPDASDKNGWEGWEGTCPLTSLPVHLAVAPKDRAAVKYAVDSVRVLSRPDYAPQDESYLPDQAARWAESVEGWMTREELLWLARHAAMLKPGSLWIEVGSWKGRSLAAVALAATARTSLLAVDTWEGSPDELDTAHAEIKEPGDRVRQAFDQTILAIKRLRPCGPSLAVRQATSLEAAEFTFGEADVVFLDAAHDYASVCADLHAWIPKVRIGGMLCGHDRGVPGVAKGLADVLVSHGLDVESGPGGLWSVCLPAGFERSPLYMGETDCQQEAQTDGFGPALVNANGEDLR